MIEIMYANHCAGGNYISNMYDSTKCHRLGGNFQKKFSLLQMFYSMLKLLIIIWSFSISILSCHVVDKWKAYEKAMEDLHKASVHELNDEFI
jgi:hypothetical protein